MSKHTTTGVGQLSFTFGNAPKDETRETQGDGSQASIAPHTVKSKRQRKLKWHSLIDKVYALPNLQKAWEAVAGNKGAPGLDGITIRKFRENSDANLQQLSNDLRAKTYRPHPVRRVYIPKNGGGKRPLGIPNVRDRIVQQALRQVLEPIFERKFSSRSHGFRPERGCVTALKVVDKAVKHGYSWVVDADIKAFFDTVDHDILLRAMNEEIADGRVLRLVRQILKAGVVEPECHEVEPTSLGTPQGGPISPLLANIYLHAFDMAMTEAGYGLVRYADDFVIFARSESEAKEALALAQSVLEGQLRLTLHPVKTRVVSAASGFEFLGFHYYRDPESNKWIKVVCRKSAKRFRQTIRQLSPRLKTQRRVKPRNVVYSRLSRNERLKEAIKRLNRFLQGWHWYFKSIWPAYTDTPFGSLDSYVRVRVRMSITGRVGNGWWNVRMRNHILHNLGLVCLNERQWLYWQGRLSAPVRKD